MRKSQPAKVVRSYGKTIADCCRKIPGGFDVEQIHELRVAYKKLRAFVRLMQEVKRSVSMPEELKDIYRSCGGVRDMQLVLERLKENAEAIPVFVKGIRHDLFLAKELLVLHIEDASVRELVKELVNDLPEAVTEEMVRQFIQRKVATIHVLLLALENEEQLHAIRKALKDLVYVKKIVETDLKFDYSFEEWKNDKKLEVLIALLGDLNDQYIALSFLSMERIQQAPAEEQVFLQHLVKEWEAAKNNMQAAAMEQVHSLQHFFRLTGT